MADTARSHPTRLDRVLNALERAGNRLPQPFLLFALLFLVVVVVSTAVAAAGAELARTHR